MLGSKLLLSTALCVTAVVGLAGMNGYVSGEGSDASVISATQIETTVSTPADACGMGSSLLPVTVDVVGAEADPVKDPIPGLNSSRVSGTAAVGGPRFKPYAADARPVERWMHEILEEPVPLGLSRRHTTRACS